jgi:N-methylhydantoinase B
VRSASILEQYKREELSPGDILITNDPWSGSGHLFDVSIIMPVFKSETELVAFVGSNIHHTDVGGYGVGTGARDIHEEGIWLPELKLFEAGKPNDAIFKIIRRNVRTPELVVGDLMGQVSCARKAAEELIKLCLTHGVAGFDEVADQIIKISKTGMHTAIRSLKSGTYCGETVFDILGGEDEEHTIRLAVALTVDSAVGEKTADFSNSSPASRFGLNVVAGYAHAYPDIASMLAFGSSWAFAETSTNYPNHEIKIVVPYSAGSSDIYVRQLEEAVTVLS